MFKARRWQLVLVLAAALVLATAASGFASRGPVAHRHQHGAAVALTARGVAFHDHMRKLWEDHITWTRLAIVSFDASLPDLPATEARLLRNQADIGRAVAPFYGRAAGRKLTRLLRSHILIAVDILADLKQGDETALAAAQKRWTRNANQIAGFLHAANPHNWPLRELRRMMHAHLALTTSEAVAHLQGRYRADVRAYDAVHREILAMADMLSSGIMRQFPGRFR
jgi:hypothetical protein